MDPQRLRTDGIAALMAFGHKRNEAVRMIDAALKPGVTTIEQLIREAYKQPRPDSRAAQTVSSPWAMAYYAYQTGANGAGEDAELLQIARAVGPGMSVQEFEQLAQRVSDIKANRAGLTNRQYQETLWAIPDAFASQRSNPVHFEPVRDPAGNPVDIPLDPIPTESIQSVATPPPASPISTDAVRAVLQRPEPQANSAEQLGAAVGNMGGGIVDNMYSKLWDDLQSGKMAQMERPPLFEQLALMGHKHGVVREPDDLRAISSNLNGSFDDQKAAGLAALNELAKKWAGSPSPAAVTSMMQQAPPPSSTGGPTDPAPIGNAGSAITAMLNAEPTSPPSSTSSTLDNIQAAADAIGVIDQTGITDLANAGISITRAIAEPEQAGHHLFNAGISAVSAIPLIGDAAKLLKLGGKGSKAAQAAKAADGSWSMAGHHSIPHSGARMDGHHTIPHGADGNPIDLGQYATGQSGEEAQQAARDLQTFTGAIEGFIEKVVPGGAALAAIGSEVYNRALKPIIDWLKQVDDTTKKMLDDNRRLANFNGGVAAAYQQLDVGRFLRDQENAGDMVGSIGRLSGAQNRYEDAQQDLLQPYNRLSADMQAARTEVAAMFLKLINSVDFIGGLLDWWYQRDQNDPGDRNDAERGARMLAEKFAEKKVGPAPAAPRPPLNRNDQNLNRLNIR